MIKRILRNQVGWAGLWLILAFGLVAVLAPFAPLNLIVSCLNLTLAVAVVIAYGREAVDALGRERATRADQLALGICLSWLFEAAQRINALVFRVSGDSSWLEWDFLTFTFFGSCLAAVLHLTAPHDIRVVPRKKSWIALWLALAAGTGIAGFLIGAQWSGS